MASFYMSGFEVLVSEPSKVYEVFVVRPPSAVLSDIGDAYNLSILETTPVFAALIGGLPQLFGSYRSDELREWLSSARGKTDIFVLVFMMLFTLFYLPQVPLRVSLTVRYIIPIVPGLVYLLMRLRLIRQLITDYQSTILWSYAFSVGLLSLLFLAVFMQSQRFGLLYPTQALVSAHEDGAIVTGSLLAGGILLVHRFDTPKVARIVAGLIGLAAAWGTVLILMTFGHYLASDLYLIP